MSAPCVRSTSNCGHWPTWLAGLFRANSRSLLADCPPPSVLQKTGVALLGSGSVGADGVRVGCRPHAEAFNCAHGLRQLPWPAAVPSRDEKDEQGGPPWFAE